MVKTKKGDTIKLIFVGRTEDGKIFDLNDGLVAKKEGLYKDGTDYTPAVVTIGEGDVVKGFDEDLEGKEVGKSYEVMLSPEKAFGKRDPSLFRLVSAAKFKQQKIEPYRGMQVNFGNQIGLVKTVSGGRVMVDFNHPLAGRKIIYDYKIESIVDDDKEILQNFSKMYLGNAEVKIEGSKATILTQVPKELQEPIKKKILKRLNKVKEIEFKSFQNKAFAAKDTKTTSKNK